LTHSLLSAYIIYIKLFLNLIVTDYILRVVQIIYYLETKFITLHVVVCLLVLLQCFLYDTEIKYMQ